MYNYEHTESFILIRCDNPILKEKGHFMCRSDV